MTLNSCSGVIIINTGNARVRQRRKRILEAHVSSAVYNQGQLTIFLTPFCAAYNQRLIRQAHNRLLEKANENVANKRKQILQTMMSWNTS